jgi:hypothetical protein
MTTFEKLRVKIKKDTDLDLFNFERCYVGYWQRSTGAFSWRAKLRFEDGGTSSYDYGSSYSASALLKEKKLTFFNHEILPNT